MKACYVHQTFCKFIFLQETRGCYRMLVGFPTAYAISVYQHLSCEFEPR